jgi:hypothetical protein
VGKQNAPGFLFACEFSVMKNQIITFVALALAVILVSGCASSMSSNEPNPTTEAAKNDRTKSSMYAR